MMEDNKTYEFNAPSLFVNLHDFVNQEPDDSFFDCPNADGGTDIHIPAAVAIQPQEQLLSTHSDIPVKTSSVPELNVKEEPVKTPVRGTPLKKSAKRNSITSGVGIRHSPRLAAIAKALRRSNASRLSSEPNAGRSNPPSSSGTQLGRVQKQQPAQSKYVPKVSGMRGLSPKDRTDLETIATFKQKIAENKKKESVSADLSRKASSRTQPTKPQEFHFATDTRLRNQKSVPETQSENNNDGGGKKSTRQGPTKPIEFHFATDTRVKGQPGASDSDAVDFAKSLRTAVSAGGPKKGVHKGPTVPQPFNLTESQNSNNKTKLEDNRFVSMAELNMKFHTRTPTRYHTKRGNEADGNHSSSKKSKSGVTIPHTPVLSTRSRSRPLNYLTHEEMEQKAYEEAQKHAFKANPVNKKALEGPSQGYKVEKKVATVPEPFNITHSNKYEQPLGSDLRDICDKLGSSTASIASLPHGGVPSRWNRTTTRLEPFSFDTRDKTKLQQKQEKIQKIIEDERKKAEFHAQRMPTFESVHGVPEKKPPTPTAVKPFHLTTDIRGSSKQEKLIRNLEEEAAADKERREFHARSDAVLHKQPFIPEKSKKPLTDISGFALNTEVRGVERKEYELHLQRKADELLAAKREHEERKAAEEAAEIAKIRKQAVHKAQPVPKIKPMEIKPTGSMPTVPISPKFATASRLRSRQNNDSTLNISSATFTAD